MVQKIFLAFLPPIVLFTFHVCAIYLFNIYRRIPNFDMPMHIGGGVAIALTTLLVYRVLREENILRERLVPWLLVFLTVSVVVFVAVGWEFAEFLADTYLGTVMQAGLADTMGDLFLGMCGGGATAAVFWRVVEQK